MRVLVVEDEEHLVGLLRGYLEREGFEVHEALDGPGALEAAREVGPDVVILDWMLPGLDGMEVLRGIKRLSDAYVLMLTARSEETDKIVGLSSGADDYLTKPFSLGELAARVRAMLRRPKEAARDAPEAPPPIRLGDLIIDEGDREVRLRGEPVDLTATEFDLLRALASRPGFVFSRSALRRRVWGERHFGDEHVVDVHVANLRKKLGEDPASPRHVETVRGIGYRFAKQ